MNHTPGPWKTDAAGSITGGPHCITPVAETYASKWAWCQATSADRHSVDAANYCGKMHEEAMANARLIAAAPELLAACEAAHGIFLALTATTVEMRLPEISEAAQKVEDVLEKVKA